MTGTASVYLCVLCVCNGLSNRLHVDLVRGLFSQAEQPGKRSSRDSRLALPECRQVAAIYNRV